jgi:hypothetical protein
MNEIQTDFLAGRPRSPAVVERGHEDAPVGAALLDGTDSARFLVRVVSYRKRLLDEDNLCEKAIVDCLRYARIVPGDAPGTTRIETTQKKVGKGEAEKTLIEIYEIEP